MKGAQLRFCAYRQYNKNPNWDHDHCSFCWTKFAVEPGPDILHAGYCTLDEYHWICPTCFHDFKGQFEWRVAPAEQTDA
ncbi:MAG TPA: hypothetical protein VFY71_16820 [Planctomycetota bacterium]|nr:hypothetical protein [Planctomycetota bacterium]